MTDPLESELTLIGQWVYRASAAVRSSVSWKARFESAPRVLTIFPNRVPGP
jgi:hypothetical protein